MIDYQFYPTPDPFTHWLFRDQQIRGRIAELGVGDGAIVRAACAVSDRYSGPAAWVTNDLDRRWPAHYHMDARSPALYDAIGPVDWHVGNPAFTIAVDSINLAIDHARVGVAMHLRASIHEVLKSGIRRTWLAQRTPTGILWLPRFAYQRSNKTGMWTQDSVCACWVIWMKDPSVPQFIRYAPEWVIDDLKTFTAAYRDRMDALIEEIRSSV